MASGFPSTFFAPDEADTNTGNTGFVPDAETGNSASMQDMQSAAASTYNTVDAGTQNLTSAIAPFVGAVADLPDLISSSIGLTNRGDVNLASLNAIGSPGLTSWYNNNRGAIEIGSAVSSLVASEFTAARFLKAGGVAMDVLSKVPYAGRIATLDNDYNQAMRAAQLVQTEVSSQAITGAAQYNTAVTLSRLGKPGLTLSSNAARRNLVFAGVAKGAVRNVVATGILAGIANQNSFLFSDDLSENLWAAGAGIALGGLLDSAMTKYAFKKFANSDTLNRVFSRTLDPNATEGARLEANRFTGALPSNRFNPYDQLHDDDTDLATSYALSVAESRNDAGILPNTKKARIFERLNSLGTQQEQQLRDTMQKATTGGIAGVGSTAFSMDSAAGKTVAQALHKDPAAFYTVSEVGRIADDATTASIASTRADGINGRLKDLTTAFKQDGWTVKRKDGTFGIRPFAKDEKDKLLGEYQRLVYRNSGVEQHLIDGEWVPSKVGRMFDSFKEPEIVKVGEDIWQPKGLMVGKNFGVKADGTLYLPKGMTIENADLNQTIGLYRSANKAINSIIASPEGKFMIPKDPHWFQLDMAEEIINRMGNDSKITYPAGLTRESAMVESFKQKASKALAAGLQDADSTDAQMMRYRFNLPRLSAAESGLMGTSEHPIETLFRGAPDRDLSTVTYQDLVKGISDVRQINGMTDLAKDRGDRTLGNMFTFNLGNDGNPLERLVAWKRPFAPFQWVKDDLSERMAMNKAVTRATLTDATAGPMSRDLTQKLLASPNFQQALKVESLQDIQMAPSTPFFGSASPQTTRGAVLNDLVYREARDRDNPVLLASARAQSDNSRATLAWMQKKVQAIVDVNDRISATGAAKSETLLNQFLTFRRGGWEFLKDPKTKKAMIKPITFPDGSAGHTFALDPKSSANQSAWKQMFGREMNAAGEVLTAPNGRAIAVDDLGKEWLDVSDFLAKDINKERNTLLRARGLGNINSTDYYAFPPNLDGKIVGFTIGPDGNTMRGGAIVANTPEEFNQKLARMRDPANKESPLNTPGATFYRKDEIEQFSNIWDKAEMDWKDPGITAAKPGQTNQGSLSGFEVDPNARRAQVLAIRDAYVRHGNDLKNYLFDNAIKSATARAAISRESTVDGLGRKAATQNSIYDYWLQNIFGRAQSKTPASPIGSIMTKVSDTINSYLKEINPSQSSIVRAASDFTRTHNPFNSSDSDKAVFDKLTTDLGNYMPFAKISDFMASKYNMKPTAELQAITAKMSQFEATSRLRMFETIQAVMNLSGIVNAMPAVIRSMQKLPGEADADFSQRIGHLGTIFTTPDAKTLGIFSMPKLLYETYKDTWNRASHMDWDYMVAHGYMTQEAAEFHRQWGVTDTASGFGKFVKGVVDKTSWLSDKSEDFSRSWGHMAGLKLADHLGIPTAEAKHSFAHDVANRMIANYDPLNRPAIFQGALGTPIGLFQSYIMNFYGRMFRYMETGDYRSLATQYAMQAGLFGAGNVPGFNEVNALMFQHGDNHNDPLDGLYKRFGPQAGDWLFGGVISNLPKLINLLPGEQGIDGVNLYSRGDANVRVPGLATGPKVRIAGKDVNLPSIPMFDTIARVFNAISTGVGMFSSSNPHKTTQQLAEVLSNMITNRPIAGLIEQTLGGGYDTDASGNVASQTQGAMESVDRILGVRSLRESKELQAYYSDMNAKQTQGALMSDLTESAKSAVRAGDSDALPEYFNEYIRRGGDPRRFTQWVNRVAKAATTTRADTLLQSLSKSKNPANTQLMQRLLDFGVSIQDNEGEGTNAPTPFNTTDESMLPGGVGTPGGGNVMAIPIEPNDAAPGYEPQGQ